jgi:hypothetical protein
MIMTIPEQLTAKGQVKSRPPMIKICEFLLTNHALKNAVVDFLSFLNDRGATLSWYVTNSYKVKYHGTDLIGIKMGNGYKNTPNTLHFCDGHCCCDYDVTVTTPTQLEGVYRYLQEKMARLDEKNFAMTKVIDKPVKLSKLNKYLVDFPAGEMKDNITKLLAWLREQKMTPQLFSPNSYKINWKGTRLCYIRFPKPITWEKLETTNDTITWRVEFVRDGYGHNDAPKNPEKNKMPKYIAPFNYDTFLMEDRLKDFMLSGLTECAGCYACKPGMPIIINGKPYNMCHIAFYNPNETAIDTLCEILQHRKAHINAEKQS